MRGMLIEEGIHFNGSHSSEFRMRLMSREGPSPEEKEILETVPFMQGSYDFSDILGQRTFENRPLTYTFEVLEYEYSRRKVDGSVLVNWLMSAGRQRLYDDFNPGYYYLAKCKSVESTDEYYGAVFTVTFEAYPYMIAELQEGHDIWDDFNFELDIAQQVKYSVKGSQAITLYNVGANVLTPVIRASAPMALTKDGASFNVPAGESNSHELILQKGSNRLTVQGSGTIEFLFYKELM